MSKCMRLLSVLCGALILQVSVVVRAGNDDWRPVAEQVISELDVALSSYQAGHAQEARRSVIQAYFGPFEGEKMEAAIRSQFGIEPAFLVERQFGALRKAIKQGAEQSDVIQLTEGLKQALREQAGKLNEAGVSRNVFEVNQ
ncbi:hypothetical protein FWJ25_02160 [Marinobacter salinexigens]|uniref:Uncharacterized protein n=1 Tax=Marinobacter salinexigens TaxID=2919747 RepID=A0A5B0VN29_9GAMM|nr:hypothetical protein [Marinobacter salinexigens]KAA1175957.1 hypothetical protein FWJ25_02160 [Marinobacter salinexigens]